MTMDEIEISKGEAVEEGGFFHLESSNSEAQNVANMIQLRRANYPTPIDFTCHASVEWTEKLTHDTIHTFRHYKELGRDWHEGTFAFSKGQNFLSVIQEAVRLATFQKLWLTFGTTSKKVPLCEEGSFLIAWIFRNGINLEHLCINHASICSSAIYQQLLDSMVEGITSSFAGPRHVRFSDLHIENDLEVAHSFADCLSLNNSLETIGLEDSGIDDGTLAVFIKSLLGKPSLDGLWLNSAGPLYGQETVAAICSLLAHPCCRLRKLELDGDENVELDAQQLANRLPANTSLLSFSLVGLSLDATDVNLLLQSVWKLKSLESLDLSESVRDKTGIAQDLDKALHRTSRLRKIDLDYDSDDDEESETEKNYGVALEQEILSLLRAFPSLDSLGDELDTLILEGELGNAVFKNQLDMNRYIGYLLHGEAVPPLALWPILMERVTRDSYLRIDTGRHANVLYNMLKGPAFAQRWS